MLTPRCARDVHRRGRELYGGSHAKTLSVGLVFGVACGGMRWRQSPGDSHGSRANARAGSSGPAHSVRFRRTVHPDHGWGSSQPSCDRRRSAVRRIPRVSLSVFPAHAPKHRICRGGGDDDARGRSSIAGCLCRRLRRGRMVGADRRQGERCGASRHHVPDHRVVCRARSGIRAANVHAAGLIRNPPARQSPRIERSGPPSEPATTGRTRCCSEAPGSR
jgi:hypothetical protein